MRGTSPGDPQSRDVPFADPSTEDLSTYTIAFVDNSDTTAWPLAWDTPFKGQRNNVVDTLTGLGADVITYDSLGEIMEPNQLYTDMNDAGVSSTQGYDWYWLNVEGFFEQLFLYGADQSPAYGPVWVGQVCKLSYVFCGLMQINYLSTCVNFVVSHFCHKRTLILTGEALT
jgi:hypothetical protein